MISSPSIVARMREDNLYWPATPTPTPPYYLPLPPKGVADLAIDMVLESKGTHMFYVCVCGGGGYVCVCVCVFVCVCVCVYALCPYLCYMMSFNVILLLCYCFYNVILLLCYCFYNAILLLCYCLLMPFSYAICHMPYSVIVF
jgi:hypothetical protein